MNRKVIITFLKSYTIYKYTSCMPIKTLSLLLTFKKIVFFNDHWIMILFY